MTSKLTREQARQIIDAADALITALAGTNDEVHKDDTDKMVRLWDDLNDRYAPPEVIRDLARMALAAMDSDPNRNPVLAYADSYRDMERQGVESVPIWSVITDLERNIAPLYRHAQQPVVDADDNFYSWFGREWQENYQHNQYTTAAKQMLGVMAESAWKAGRRAAMLSAAQHDTPALNSLQSVDSVADTWIPVSERMPEGSEEVLCAKEFDGPGDWRKKVGYLLAGKWTVYGASWAPTHWMPLPAAPQEENP